MNTATKILVLNSLTILIEKKDVFTKLLYIYHALKDELGCNRRVAICMYIYAYFIYVLQIKSYSLYSLGWPFATIA